MNQSRLAAVAAFALGLTFPPLADAQDNKDQATPPDKATTGEPDSGKRPPASLMDGAAPDRNSPGAAQDEAAPGSTQEETPPGAAPDENAPGALPDDQLQQEGDPRASTGIRV